jgi:hypothetical protein
LFSVIGRKNEAILINNNNNPTEYEIRPNDRRNMEGTTQWSFASPAVGPDSLLLERFSF